MKRILLLVLALAMTASLCACGGAAKKPMDLDALAAELAAGGGFTDILSQPADSVAARLYGFAGEDVTRYILYTGTGATAEEVFLAETASAKAASSLKAACRERVENQKLVFAEYSPEEVQKLDDAVLATRGRFVVLVISADAEAARSIVEGYV